LRELTAETQRLDEIKRVREDVTRQVEVARQEVVDENKALQQRIRSLESGPEGAAALRQRIEEQEQLLQDRASSVKRAEAECADLESRLEAVRREATAAKAELGDARGALDEAARRTEEERWAFERRIAHAEAGASVAADEFAEERERLEAQVKALRVEMDTAMAVRAEESEASRAAERQAAAQREAALEEALAKSRCLGALCRWRQLAEASLHKPTSAQADETWREVLRAAHQWRALARGHERDGVLLGRQTEELERLDGEAEFLREQNRQVLLSLQQAQLELQWSLAETRRLQEREAAYEGDLLRLSERSAELAGHANPKQKIKHLMDLKAENNTLRGELKKTKQQVSQLEVQLRTANFFDTVSGSTLCDGNAGSGPGRCQTPRKPVATTPGRQALQTPRKGEPQRDPLFALAEDRPEAARRERAEAVRHARAHRRASERAAVEYQHLASIVEQVLALHPGRGSGASSVANSAMPTSGMVTPDARASEATGCSAEPGVLLHRLRELAAELTGGKKREPSSLLETPQTQVPPTTVHNSPELEEEDSATES